MTPATESQLITEQTTVADAIRNAYDAQTPVIPIGGRTSLDYGGPPPQEARRLDLTGLRRIVDYTPRDMTIVVESGVRMADLIATLAAEGQQLPIDVPRSTEATVGGAVATNWSGPRRCGYGTFRDYVIGIHAVDGRGVPFKGGGRVVKNVAGYDFCKLLTGSLGTLGVITQLAFKVKPIPDASEAAAVQCADLATVGRILERLGNLPAPPVAIDVLIGTAWQLDDSFFVGEFARGPFIGDPVIVTRFEGTEREARGLASDAQYEMWNNGGKSVARVVPKNADALWRKQLEFADRGPGEADDNSPLVLKIAVSPSAVCRAIAEVLKHDPQGTIQAHAASGIVFARFASFTQADVNLVLVGKLRPAIARLGGSVIVVRTTLNGLTPHLRWGGRTEATVLMERIKQKFDPHNILNPGRFIY